jgi:hypothetical protein
MGLAYWAELNQWKDKKVRLLGSKVTATGKKCWKHQPQWLKYSRAKKRCVLTEPALGLY